MVYGCVVKDTLKKPLKKYYNLDILHNIIVLIYFPVWSSVKDMFHVLRRFSKKCLKKSHFEESSVKVFFVKSIKKWGFFLCCFPIDERMWSFEVRMIIPGRWEHEFCISSPPPTSLRVLIYIFFYYSSINVLGLSMILQVPPAFLFFSVLNHLSFVLMFFLAFLFFLMFWR